MRKILFCIVVFGAMFLPAKSFGQWGFTDSLTFDYGDTSWPHFITIDTINYHHNIWQVGRPQKAVFDSAYSYPNVIITDTVGQYPTNDTSVFYFSFKSLYNSHIGCCYFLYSLGFYYQLNIDSNSTASIDFSIDSGATWITSSSSNTLNFISVLPPLSNTTGWTNWDLYMESRDTISDSVIFRFTFISSSDTVAHNGWMMDNFSVSGYPGEGVPTIQNNKDITLYPNPASTELTVQSSGEAIEEVVIYNVLGQVVASPRPSPGEREVLRIDVSSLASGVYFVRVNGSVVRKPACRTGRFLKE